MFINMIIIMFSVDPRFIFLRIEQSAYSSSLLDYFWATQK